MARWLLLAGAVLGIVTVGNLFPPDSERIARCRADEVACPISEPCQAGEKDKPLKLPPGWKPDDPLPVEKTNCVRCHLTAGRELTTPVREFARSVHDLAQLSCNSCHGGNTKDDATAHEDKFGFIGTKISTHIAACNSCHDREGQQFKKSKHWWDLTKKINRKYPTCVDCHGNHDVARPPAEFSMTNVCTDCHKQFAKDFPAAAEVVTENDALWKVLRDVQTKNKKLPDPIPEKFRKEVNGCRAATARLMHRGQPITAKEADTLNTRVKRLRGDLESWLKEP